MWFFVPLRNRYFFELAERIIYNKQRLINFYVKLHLIMLNVIIRHHNFVEITFKHCFVFIYRNLSQAKKTNLSCILHISF